MIFRKRKPLGEYANVDGQDLAVLQALVTHGADLTRPRHVLHYLYVADEETAGSLAGRAEGWAGSSRPPPEGYQEWTVLFERSEYVLTPENVINDRELFAALAASVGGTYDGWEASV